MSESKKITKIHPKTIAQQLEEFERLVAWFGSEDFGLETALEKFHEAEKVAGEIEKQLASVKNEVEVLKQKFTD